MDTNGHKEQATLTCEGREYTVEIHTFTPEEAARELKRMAHNRPKKPGKVFRIAEAMSRGEFLLNGQVIIYDSAGCIIDGQHRLQACVDSGQPFTTFVIRGVSTKAFSTLDAFDRTLQDFLASEYAMDKKKAANTAAVINMAYGLRHSHSIHGRAQPMTWTALEFYNDERKAIDLHVGEATEKFKTKLLPIGKMVALWHEFDVVNEDIARKFFLSMCDLDHELKAFDTLRKLFTSDLPKPPNRRIKPKIKIAYCIKAFNAVIEGKEDCAFRMSRRESFPIISTGKETSVDEAQPIAA